MNGVGILWFAISPQLSLFYRRHDGRLLQLKSFNLGLSFLTNRFSERVWLKAMVNEEAVLRLVAVFNMHKRSR